MGIVKKYVLFSRKGNENFTSPHYPVGEWTGQVDLDEVATFFATSDWDMRITAAVYEVREVALPDWLPVDEWAKSAERWRVSWSSGVDMTWPESWQRGLDALPFEKRFLAAQLLRTRNSKNAFRLSLREQLVQWLETPELERRYKSPFSRKQWWCINKSPLALRLAERRAYSKREIAGRLLSKDEAMALVQDKAA